MDVDFTYTKRGLQNHRIVNARPAQWELNHHSAKLPLLTCVVDVRLPIHVQMVTQDWNPLASVLHTQSYKCPPKLLENYRCGQLEAILPVLHDKDAFVRMATGTGKSLRGFSVPLTLSDGSVAVIVGPLNGRMHKHVSDRFADLNDLQ